MDDDGSLLMSEHEGERYLSAKAFKRKIQEKIAEERVLHSSTISETDAEKALNEAGIFGIHENFRIFSAMTRAVRGANRLSLAMRNRMSEIWIDELPAGELQTVVAEYLDASLPTGKKQRRRWWLSTSS